jgi:hypothetical protein
MLTLLWWVLMLGGVVTTFVAASLSAEIEAEVALALGGLLATIGGAVGLLLARVAGDTPPDLRPPGASSRPRAPSTGGPRPPRRSGRTRDRDRSRASPTDAAASRAAPAGASVAPSWAAASVVTPAAARPPVQQAIPTAPARRRTSRLPLLAAAFVAGIAWDLTATGDGGGALDLLAGFLVLATPLAIVVAVATRLLRGSAWSPAVTVVMASAALLLGSLAAEFALDLLG